MLYRGDYGTYERAKSAMSISDTELDFLPCIGAFHLQMTWSQVSTSQFIIIIIYLITNSEVSYVSGAN